MREKALRVLFDSLLEHGHQFSNETWRMIFSGVIFPIFDDLRGNNEEKLCKVLLLCLDL